MITNFVIDDSALRLKEVARRRAIFSIVAPAAKAPVSRRVPKLVCRWAIDPLTGRLRARWAEDSPDAGATQNCDQDMDPGRPGSRIPPQPAIRARTCANELQAA
jgi:hypothetical protein